MYFFRFRGRGTSERRSFIFMSLNFVFFFLLFCFRVVSFSFFLRIKWKKFPLFQADDIGFYFAVKRRKKNTSWNGSTHTKLLHLLFKMLWKVKLQKKVKTKRNPSACSFPFASTFYSTFSSCSSMAEFNTRRFSKSNADRFPFRFLFRFFSWNSRFFIFMQTFCQITKCVCFFLRFFLRSFLNACFIELLSKDYNTQAHTHTSC